MADNGNGTNYEPLPGRRMLYVEDSRLWLGPDHVLHSRRGVTAERYRRFPYGDIQAILIRKTDAGKIYNLALLLLSVTLAFLAAFATMDADGATTPGTVIGWSTTSLALLLLVVNAARGATCRFVIYTAIQEERVPGISRLPAAQQAAALLRARIEQAQGVLLPEEVSRIPAHTDSAQAAVAPTQTGPAEPPKLHKETGAMHRALFIVLLAGAPFFLADLFITASMFTRFVDILTFLWIMSSGALVMVALARQRNSDLGDGLKTLTRVAMGFVIVLVVFVWVVTVATSSDTEAVFITLLRNDQAPGPVIAALDMVSLIGALGIGLTGLVFLSDHKRLQRMGAAEKSVGPVSESESDAPAQDDVDDGRPVGREMWLGQETGHDESETDRSEGEVGGNEGEPGQ